MRLDTERPGVPVVGFSLDAKWKSPLHPLFAGTRRFSCLKKWGTSNSTSWNIPARSGPAPKKSRARIAHGKAVCSTGRAADWPCRILPPSRTLQNPSRWLEGFYRFSPLHGASTLQWGLKNFEARKFAEPLQTKGQALLSSIYFKKFPPSFLPHVSLTRERAS